MARTLAEIVTELRMLIAEWLLLLACYAMTPESAETEIWCRYLKAASEEIAISIDCEATEEESWF